MGVAIPGGGGSLREDAVSGAKIIDGSLRFDSAKTQYLSRTPTSTGNRKTWTWSLWIKRTTLGTQSMVWSCGGSNVGGDYDYLECFFNSSNKFGIGTLNGVRLVSTQVFRDPNAWMHLLVKLDTTQATVSNRLVVYVNGTEITAWDTDTRSTYFTQSSDQGVNRTEPHLIGRQSYSGSDNSNHYLSEVQFIDGQALDPSYFGYTDPLTNTWRPKKFKPQATPNNGTVWSSTGSDPNSKISSGSIANVFSGSVTTGIVITQSSTNQYVTMTTGPIQCNSTVSFLSGNGLSTATMRINGSDTYKFQAGSTTTQWWDFNFSGTITKIELGYLDGSGSSNTFYGLKVDGVPLVDSNITNIGKNGFYLPLDGNSPIGQDKSSPVGTAVTWTPVNFGGSNTIEKATGALPILLTDGGGKVARVGVRTDATVAAGVGTCVLALPLVGIKSDFSNKIDGRSTEKVITANGNAAASSTQSNFYGGSFNFDGTGDYLSLSSSNFAVGTNDFTVEAWVYQTGGSGGAGGIFSTSLTDSSIGIVIAQDRAWIGNNGSQYYDCNPGSDPFFTLNTWHHIAYVKSGTNGYLFLDGVLKASATGQTPQNITNTSAVVGRRYAATDNYYFNGYIQDLRFYNGIAKYTSNFIPASTDPDIVPDSPSGVSYSSNVALVPSTDGAVAFDGSGDWLSLPTSSDFTCSSGTNFTFEAFIYPTSVSDTTPFGIGNNAGFAYRIISGSPYLYIAASGGILNTGTIAANKWTHIAVTRNSGTLYSFIDGVLVGSVANSGSFDGTQQNFIGAANLTGAGSPGYTFTGHISNAHWVNGTALYTSNFTPPTAPISSVANTKLLCCKSNSSATAYDVSPGTITANGNATATNFNPFTANINTQRGKQSGWCTLNPLDTYNLTTSNGNLTVSASSAHGLVRGNVGMNTATGGKYYWEHTSSGWSNQPAAGIVGDTAKISDQLNTSPSRFYRSNGSLFVNGTENVGWGPSWTTSDTIGVAFDATNGILNFYVNGILVGSPVTGLTGTWLPGVKMYDGTSYLNFGQKPFKFPPPAGFQPLTLANTSRPTIVRPDQYVGIVTYTGNGAAGRSISGLGFQPDFVWLKNRSDTYHHQLHDSVRGASSGALYSSLTNAQDSNFPLTSFDSAGFTLGNTASLAAQSQGSQNFNGNGFVAWCWKAGGNKSTYNIDGVGYATTTAAGLSGGTINPTGASINTKSGFSIITYTGNGSTGTIPHGLGVAPKMIILKDRTSTNEWAVYHANLTSAAYYLSLNQTIAQTSAAAWNSTAPTSTVFSVGGVSNTSNNYVAYLWSEVAGFSKFGSYTGNGSSDGPFVFCNFRPRWIMVKRTDVSNNWEVWDTTRSSYNAASKYLNLNLSDAEYDFGTTDAIDITANGFKLRASNNAVNASSGTYIFAAFAETPTQNLFGGQANAR